MAPEYMLLTGNKEDLIKQVNEYLWNGWEMQGRTFYVGDKGITTGFIFSQTMIKRNY